MPASNTRGSRYSSPRIANTLNNTGHTMLCTASLSDGNQNVTESSASDGAGCTSMRNPATFSVVAAENGCVTGR